MALLDVFRAPKSEPTVIASETYYTGNTNLVWGTAGLVGISRAEAMQVPAVARARNIICGTIGSLPLERYNVMTGEHMVSTPLEYQPDPDSPRSVSFAWLADSIWFYGVGYVQVLSTYADSGRPNRWRWLDPLRVSPILNQNQTLALGYNLDGQPMPTDGVGSIIAFPGIDEGILARAGRTIRTALELEQAAYRAAQEPVPQTVLTSTGLDLPKDKITEVLTKWKTARQTRSTAYLFSGLKMETIGFDPKSQQLVEARQFTASEIARATGIPAWYLNAETASMTYSNTEQERRTLVDFSLRNIIAPIEDRYTMLASRAVECRFDLDDFLRGNATERVDITLKLLDAGLITIDEARAREDLTPQGMSNQ